MTNLKFLWVVFLFVLTVSLIVGLNYFVQAFTLNLAKQYESRCYGDVVSETHYSESDISIGCFCEDKYAQLG